MQFWVHGFVLVNEQKNPWMGVSLKFCSLHILLKMVRVLHSLESSMPTQFRNTFKTIETIIYYNS